jgi:hypothetical protein
MVETRAQAQGHPLKKEGAYNTDAYYQEKDDGFGDVGVNQEADAGVKQADNTAEDPDFTVSAEENRAADTEGAQDVQGDMPMAEDVADLQAGTTEDVDTTGAGGEPIGVTEESNADV